MSHQFQRHTAGGQILLDELEQIGKKSAAVETSDESILWLPEKVSNKTVQRDPTGGVRAYPDGVIAVG